MANEDHLVRLKQGVAAWNQWREANRDVQPDLSMANLIQEDLSAAYLSGVNLMRANLTGANLSRAYLAGAYLSGANLTGAILSEADLTRAHLSGGRHIGVRLTKDNVIVGFLTDPYFTEPYLAREGPTIEALATANVLRVHPDVAHLTEVAILAGVLSGADLSGADLAQADLSEADLAQANLSGANLSGAILVQADLSEATLAGADLSGAYLGGATLSRVDLSGVNLSAISIASTILMDVDLSTALGLDTVVHHGPSTIGIDTLYRSHGNIPEVFLRGAGVPDEMITYMKSLVGRPFEFYSCFISYSTKDQAFAERLHADLQNKGVRCWFAPEDIRGGRKLHEQIDQAIRVYERLLLILSTDSMQSGWVKTEIAKARQREVREKRQVLFPVRLVSFEAVRDWECFDADTGKDSAREIREYFIPDFSNWKNHDAYQVAFQRLLRDLKAGT